MCHTRLGQSVIYVTHEVPYLTTIDEIRSAALGVIGEVYRRYPQPIAVVLAREINEWVNHGHRYGGSGQIMQLIQAIQEPPTQSGSLEQKAS